MVNEGGVREIFLGHLFCAEDGGQHDADYEAFVPLYSDHRPKQLMDT